jgi:hypothetical protein
VTSSEFDVFLSGAAWICALMAIVVLFRVRSRGVAAYIMSVAFLALGGVLYLVKTGAPQPWIIAGGVLVGALLLLDLLVRSSQQANGDGKP